MCLNARESIERAIAAGNKGPHRVSIEVREAPAAGYLRLTVADTGAGIEEKVRRHLFAPFFTTKGSAGTGLGLAMVHGIVRRHAGWIELQSEPGRGADFVIFLPDGRRKAAPEAPGGIQIEDTGKQYILMVDDEAIVRNMGCRILEQLGYGVIAAASGEEAIALFDSAPGNIAAAIVDMYMTGISGRQTLLALRDRAPAFPVILTSGDTGAEPGESAAEYQPTAFLHKPYTIATLAALLQDALSGKSRLGVQA